MTDDFKPCPFCGSTSVRVFPLSLKGVCLACLAEGPQRQTESEAIAAWNTRAAPPVKPLEWVEGVTMTSTVSYRVAAYATGWGLWWNDLSMSHPPYIEMDSEAAAKAAANADYTRRIHAALGLTEGE